MPNQRILHRRSRWFAALLALAGVYSLLGGGGSGVPELGGVLGVMFALAAMRGQTTVRRPLAVGALASVGAAASLALPASAGSSDEFIWAGVWFGCSALMLVTGVVAVIWSLVEEGPIRSQGSRSSR